MWYYIKDNKVIGPVAESAVMSLFQSREISRDTLVRSEHDKGWRRFKMTRFFRKHGGRRSQYIENLALSSKIFRAFLLAYTIIIGLSLILDIHRYRYFNRILDGMVVSDITNEILKRDYVSLTFLSRGIMFFLFLCILYALMRWLKNIVFNGRILDKEFQYSPRFAAWSVLIPLINLIHPFSTISLLYKISKQASGKSFNIFDFSFIMVWWFFNIFSLLVFFISNWMLKVNMTLDRAKAILVFNMYETGIIIFTCILWIVMVTKIYRLQKKAFEIDS